MEPSLERSNENDIEGLIAKRDQIKEAHDKLAEKIINSQKIFDSPGMNPDEYGRLKADEDKWAGIGDIPDNIIGVDSLRDEFAANRIKLIWEPFRDRLIKEFAPNWIDAVPVDDVRVGDVFIVPVIRDSQFAAENGLFPWQLQIIDGMDEDLENLIMVSRELHDVNLAINSVRPPILKSLRHFGLSSDF